MNLNNFNKLINFEIKKVEILDEMREEVKGIGLCVRNKNKNMKMYMFILDAFTA